MVAKELNILGGELQGRIINAIIKMMKDNDVKIISFVNNGNYSDFDFDKSYVFDKDDYGVAYEAEVIAVYTDGRSIEILYDNDNISLETIDILEENDLIYDNKLAKKIYKENDFVTIDSTLAPTDTLLQLVYSVEEALDALKKSDTNLKNY